MADRYFYRREDNGCIIEVSFEVAINQEPGGFITTNDGVVARRVTSLEPSDGPTKTTAPENVPPPKIVSDSLGCPAHQVEQLRDDAKRNGFTGISFERDPTCEYFYQAHVGSTAEWRRYIKHRGLHDKNGRNGGGASLSPALLERSAQRLLEQSR